GPIHETLPEVRECRPSRVGRRYCRGWPMTPVVGVVFVTIVPTLVVCGVSPRHSKRNGSSEMTSLYRLLTKSGHTLTDWHFDSFDGPRVRGERLDGWSDEALQNIKRHVARLRARGPEYGLHDADFRLITSWRRYLFACCR